MKKFALSAVFALLLISSPTWATEKPPAGSTTNNSATAGAVGVGVGIGTGGAANADAHGIGVGHGGSAVSQGGSSRGGNAVASPTLKASQSLNLSVVQEAAEQPVNSAIAPGMAVSNGTCFGSGSGAITVPGWSIGGGGPTLDKGCDTRYDAALLVVMGEVDSAVERVCMKEEIRQARKEAGRPCKADREAAKRASLPVQRPDMTDPLVRRREGLPPL